MKIDLHTHILPPSWPDLEKRFGYGGFVALEHHGPGCARMIRDGKVFREITANAWDPERRIEECDAHGVAMQVLSTVPVMFSYWARPEHTADLARFLNDHLAEVVRKYPGRFAGLGTLPMQDADLAIGELQRCVGQLGLRGVQIGTHVNGQNLDEPALFPVFVEAERLGACVFVHPWDMLGEERMGRYWLRWLVGMPAETALAICSVIFSGLLDRLPHLRLGFAHGGGAFPGTLGRIEHGCRVRPDLCGTNGVGEVRTYLGRFYLDSLVHDAEMLRRLIALVGCGRLALGSDYPFPLGEHEPGRLIESLEELSEEQRGQLLAGTAREFLGLEPLEALHSKTLNRMTTSFRADEEFALSLDAADPLAPFREEFLIPPGPDGKPSLYLCGHSLGLQPRAVRALLQQELDDWAHLGVEGHFHGRTPWYSYHETLREPGARLVGALPDEVVFMNSLTVNLHLMMLTFYRPAGRRRGILIDEPAFPSDRYAIHSQLRHHRLEPAEALFHLTPRDGEDTLREEDIEAFLDSRGEEIALVLFNGVNFVSGQRFDLARITAAGHRHGCLVGFDLAHAVGNVPLALHEWDVDFAVWCSYKYLNAGPGAVGGCFVHERHGNNLALPRLAGWWGNDPATRFSMQTERAFHPRAGADGWQLSNPPILAMAPVRASLDLFDRASMTALRGKSQRLTGYLLDLLDNPPSGGFEVLTPRSPERRGCQVSLRIGGDADALVQRLLERGVVCDHREPNVLRIAPVPLYNTFHDVWAFTRALTELIGP